MDPRDQNPGTLEPQKVEAVAPVEQLDVVGDDEFPEALDHLGQNAPLALQPEGVGAQRNLEIRDHASPVVEQRGGATRSRGAGFKSRNVIGQHSL